MPKQANCEKAKGDDPKQSTTELLSGLRTVKISKLNAKLNEITRRSIKNKLLLSLFPAKSVGRVIPCD